MTINREKYFYTFRILEIFPLLRFHHVRVQYPLEHYIIYDADVGIVSKVLKIKVKRHLRSLKMPMEDSKSV